MALTFNSLHTAYQEHTSDTTAANVTIGKNRINDTHKELLAMHDWYFAETTATFTPTASTYSYNLPYNFGRAIAIRVDVDDVHYVLEEVASHEEWQKLQMYRDTQTSNYPTHYHITGDTFEIYPIFSTTTASNLGTIHYVKRVVDMQYDDYTTSTASITNGATALTSAAAVWTASFVGRYFKINTGARWYEISARVSDTALTLKKSYQEATASAESYTIGEIPIIPEDYHNLLYYQPVAQYWMMKKDTNQAAYYQALYDKGKKEFFNAYSKRTSSQILNPIGAVRRRPITAYGANRWDEPTLAWDDSNEFWGGS